MKVFVVIAIVFVVAIEANPAFRALRARASGLGGGTPPAAPSQPVANTFAASPVNPGGFRAPVQPQQYQPQQYQPQQFQPQAYQPQPFNTYNPSAAVGYPRAPFTGFQ